MDVAGIQSGMVGMAMFDAWFASFKKMTQAQKAQGRDPLVAAACDAFEQYLGTVETQNNALVQGLATYALSPKGNGAQLMSQAQMAPFLALSVMA